MHVTTPLGAHGRRSRRGHTRLARWLGAVALAALAAAADGQERLAREGYLTWQNVGLYHKATLRGFVDGLRAEGFVEGRNLELLRRSASNDASQFKPLARELAAARVVVIDEVLCDACAQELEHFQRAARDLRLALFVVHVDRPERLDAAFEQLRRERVQAVTTTMLSTRNNLEREYAQAALRARLASMFELEVVAREGGLMSYGPDFETLHRRTGRYAGRVLEGERPAEMAMEEPREFKLVLNLKTAREIGPQFPPAVRLRADEVIE